MAHAHIESARNLAAPTFIQAFRKGIASALNPLRRPEGDRITAAMPGPWKLGTSRAPWRWSAERQRWEMENAF